MMTKIKFGKILLAMILCVGYFFPTAVFAADKIQTQFNPLCWTEKECSDKRAELWGEERAAGGWLEKEGEECNKTGWGKCLAGNVTKTEVSFGGKTQFSNIGEYIKTIYNYGLVAIGILAVVVLIIAGAQWITSAGSAEVITQSKKRISGAIIGLFIAYMSFIILKSINPATVNLRLPQVYLIKSQVLASKWCRDLKEDQMFAYAADGNKQSDKVKATGDEALNMNYKASSPDKFWCGQRFFVQGAAPDVTCLGDRCNKGQVCTDIEPVDKKNPFQCKKATIAGEISGLETGVIEGVTDENTWEAANNDIELYLVCEDTKCGSTEDVDIDFNITDENNGKQSYVVLADEEDLNDAVNECGGAAKVRGGYMNMEFTPNVSTNPSDENHAIGNGGRDIWYIIPGPFDDPIEDCPVLWKTESFIPLSALQSGTMVDIKAKDVQLVESASEIIFRTFDLVFGDLTLDEASAEFYRRYKSYFKSEYAEKLTTPR